MPFVSDLISKFLTRSALTLADREALSADLGYPMAVNVIFGGDSILDHRVTDVAARIVRGWPVAVAGVHNTAEGGTTTAEMIDAYVAHARPHTPEFTGVPAVYVCNGGINDIALIPGVTALDIYNRLKTRWAMARGNGCKVWAATLHFMWLWLENPAFEAKRRQLNALIASDPSLYDELIRWDLAMPYTTGNELPDGVHPAGAGSRILAGAVNGIHSGALRFQNSKLFAMAAAEAAEAGENHAVTWTPTDNNAIFLASKTVTITEPGWYRMSATLVCDAPPGAPFNLNWDAADRLTCWLNITNGGELVRNLRGTPAGGAALAATPHVMQLYVMKPFQAGDVLRIYTRSDGPTPAYSLNDSFMSVERLRESVTTAA